MSVAATNEWYHAERRVMSKHQRRSGRVQRRRPRWRRFESFGRIFFYYYYIFFAPRITKKIIFPIENILRGFKKEII